MKRRFQYGWIVFLLLSAFGICYIDQIGLLKLCAAMWFVSMAVDVLRDITADMQAELDALEDGDAQ